MQVPGLCPSPSLMTQPELPVLQPPLSAASRQDAAARIERHQELMRRVLSDPQLVCLQREGGAVLARLRRDAARLRASPHVRYGAEGPGPSPRQQHLPAFAPSARHPSAMPTPRAGVPPGKRRAPSSVLPAPRACSHPVGLSRAEPLDGAKPRCCCTWPALPLPSSSAHHSRRCRSRPAPDTDTQPCAAHP